MSNIPEAREMLFRLLAAIEQPDLFGGITREDAAKAVRMSISMMYRETKRRRDEAEPEREAR